MRRELPGTVSRIVLKLGTGILTDARKQPDPEQMGQLVAQVAEQCQAGREVVLVTSGAVGAGMGALGCDRRPTELAELQACAAIGQSRLMATYAQLFSQYNRTVAQVLLTHEDLAHHERHLNARNTLVTLLQRGVVPIINENDAVSVTELKFGDNDTLSALVACLLPADLLVILTSVDGLVQNLGQPTARVLPIVERIDATIESLAGDTASATAVGGMKTKIDAARISTRAGIPLVIASGRRPGVLGRILANESEGTMFVPRERKLRSRKRWIAFFPHPRGTLLVDDGAARALREKGRSLLLPGVRRCEGEFRAGDVVRICNEEGTEFARGIAAFGAQQIRARRLPRTELVHRDNLALL